MYSEGKEILMVMFRSAIGRLLSSTYGTGHTWHVVGNKQINTVSNVQGKALRMPLLL